WIWRPMGFAGARMFIALSCVGTQLSGGATGGLFRRRIHACMRVGLPPVSPPKNFTRTWFQPAVSHTACHCATPHPLAGHPNEVGFRAAVKALQVLTVTTPNSRVKR